MKIQYNVYPYFQYGVFPDVTITSTSSTLSLPLVIFHATRFDPRFLILDNRTLQNFCGQIKNKFYLTVIRWVEATIYGLFFAGLPYFVYHNFDKW